MNILYKRRSLFFVTVLWLFFVCDDSLFSFGGVGPRWKPLLFLEWTCRFTRKFLEKTNLLVNLGGVEKVILRCRWSFLPPSWEYPRESCSGVTCFLALWIVSPHFEPEEFCFMVYFFSPTVFDLPLVRLFHWCCSTSCWPAFLWIQCVWISILLLIRLLQLKKLFVVETS